MTEEIENVSTPAEGEQAVVVAETPEAPMDLDTALAKAFEAAREPEPAKVEKVEEPAPEVEAKAEAEPAPEAETEVEAEVEGPEAPADWSDEQKAVFSKLPVEGRELLLKQSKSFQADYTKKTQALAERRRMADEIEGLLTSTYGDAMRSQNVTPEEAIQRLVAAERFATQNPVAFLQQFVQNNHIDLTKLQQATAGTEQAQASGIDPAAIDRMVQARLAPVTKALEAQQVAEGMRRVIEFKEAKDPSGQLLHPHLNDDVAARMTALFQSKLVPAGDMEAAYKAAVRMDDALFAAEIEAAGKAKIEQEKAKQAEAVAKAKKAAGTAVPKSATPPQTAKKVLTLEDALANAFAQHNM